MLSLTNLINVTYFLNSLTSKRHFGNATVNRERRFRALLRKMSSRTIFSSHSLLFYKYMTIHFSILHKGVAMIFGWGGPDFKPQTDDR
jgi:hypothetical protein